jgi:hypothetical protein
MQEKFKELTLPRHHTKNIAAILSKCEKSALNFAKSGTTQAAYNYFFCLPKMNTYFTEVLVCIL